jgi:hypothetical protein
MAHLPFLQFYPADWLQDTRVLSLEARGAWIDLLCAMWVAPERGKLDWTQDQFEHFLGLDYMEATEIWNELIASGIGEFEFHEGPPRGGGGGVPISRNSTSRVTVMSRRMYRENTERNQARERQSRKRHGPVTQMSRGIYQKSEVRSHISEEDPPSVGLDISANGKEKKEMGTSMNLSPELKEQSDRLYLSDTKKFNRLAAWIGQGRKHGYRESDMAEALSQFWEYRFIDDWYPYLDQILDKVVKNQNAGEHDLETERLRQEAKEFTEGKPALALVRGLGQAKGMK